MKTIQVARVPFPLPVLGFGCTGLMGPRTDRERRRFLEVAFDAGIRHFDVARYYGYGEAERIVGQFAREKRNQITITTKFGINPPRRAGPMRVAASVARRVARLLPFTRRAISKQAGKLVKFGQFSADEARKSLETSLAELRTDHVDFFLIHGFRAQEPASEELMGFLERAVSSGQVRHFGVGTDIDSVISLCEQRHPLAGVVQFENSVIHRNTERVPAGSGSIVITFQALSESYRTVQARLDADSALKRTWSEQIDLDLGRPGVLAELMLCFALHANPDGLVLFQSRNLDRIRANARVAERQPFAAARLTAFARLVAEAS